MFPYPNGYLVRFSGEEQVEAAGRIRVGDKAEAVGFTPETSPRKYVELDGRFRVEIAYRNESRTGTARAVLYDGNFAHDSTQTNIWGMEVAVGADGRVQAIVPMGTEGVSGDTVIPEGGFVLSAGYALYRSYFERLEAGCTAEYVEKDGVYFFYALESVRYNASDDGEVLLVFDASEKPSLTLEEGAAAAVADGSGYILSLHTTPGAVKVPEGGRVIFASNYEKKLELLRFAEPGQRVIFDEDAGKLYLYGSADYAADVCAEKYADLAARIAAAKQALTALDYAAIDAQLEEAEALLAAGEDYDALLKAAVLLDGLEYKLVPSFAVQDRAAWVAFPGRTAADVRKTAAYAESLGLNTLIVSPFESGYALYDTDLPHLEKHPELAEDTDILQCYVDECRARGIRLYFMYCCFGTQEPSDAYSADHYVNFFADKLLLNKQGGSVATYYEDSSYSLNPFDAEVRAWTKDLLAEVAARYDVDGIQLDYIRFPLPNSWGENYNDHGYNEDMIRAFMEQAQTDVNPKDMRTTDLLWESWCAFRRDVITSFVREVSELLRDTGLIFSCTCFADYNDRQMYVYQDVEKWAGEGLIDELYPMIYAATAEEHIERADEIAAGIGESCRLVLGLGTYDGQTPEIVAEQAVYNRTAGGNGNSIFALPYTQVFGFDRLYAEGLYRKPAVHTDDCGAAMPAFLAELCETIDSTYLYLCPDCGAGTHQGENRSRRRRARRPRRRGGRRIAAGLLAAGGADDAFPARSAGRRRHRGNGAGRPARPNGLYRANHCAQHRRRAAQAAVKIGRG